MLSTKRDDSHVRSRLAFSQASQATPSQQLNTKFGNCNIADASQMALTMESDFPMSQSQYEPSQSQYEPTQSQCQPTQSQCLPAQADRWNSMQLGPSQPGGLGSQDYVTPAEQQYDVEPGKTGKVMRSPSRKSPQKPAKRHCGIPMGAYGSQSSQIPFCPPPQGRAMPDRRPIKCAHNPFIQDACAEEVSVGSRLPKISIYKEIFKEGNLLGRGNFSKVHHVTNRVDGVDYAVKRSNEVVTEERLKKQWYQEIAALAAGGCHPNLVRYFFAWVEEQDNGVHFYIQLERCGTTLEHRAGVERAPFKESVLLDLLRQMAGALQHLHSRGIAHMDVKPDNIYESEDGAFKLGDFGLATSLEGATSLGIEEGDSRYLAPEMMNDAHPRLDKIDMFALGALLYRLATGCELPEGGQAYQDIREGKLKMLPALSVNFQNMIKRLMSKKPQDRPSPSQVLADKLLNKGPANGYRQLDLFVSK